MSADPVLFVCGTLRDKGGFESVALGGRRLPVDVADRVDRFSQETGIEPGRPGYLCGRIETGRSGATVAVYAEYRWIEPSDAPINRGAYIAVGFCAGAPLDPVQAAAAFWCIEATHRDLAARRGGGHSFPQDFTLRDYAVSLEATPGGWPPESWPRESELEQYGILAAEPDSGQDAAFEADEDRRQPAGAIAEAAANPAGAPPWQSSERPRPPQVRLERSNRWRNMNDLEMIIAGTGLIVWGALAIGLFLAAQALIG